MNGTIEHVRPDFAQAASQATVTDEQLLTDYRTTGNRAAFEELVRRYERELFGYLRHYLGSAEAAEDVFQLTCLQVHLKCDQYEPGRQVRPWLYTVATHQAIDYRRRNRRHRMASLDRRSGHDGEEGGALSHWLDSPEPGPAEQTETHESYERLRLAIEELPEQTKQMVLLVYFQGLKYREAAAVMKVPVGTVKSRMHVVLGRLEEILTRTHLPR
jgi:RNA polymerase sigma-70 factor (ECF subfamily)